MRWASFHRAYRDGLESHGATIEQPAGDEVMAVSESPSLTRTMPFARPAPRSRYSARSGLYPTCSSGRAVGGSICVSGSTRARYSPGTDVAGHGFIAGPAIGLAKRLQQAALPGEILVGEEALGLLGDTVETEPFQGARPGDRRVLGIVEGAPALARHLEVALVGREHEASRRCEQRSSGSPAKAAAVGHDHRGGRDRKNATRGRADLEPRGGNDRARRPLHPVREGFALSAGGGDDSRDRRGGRVLRAVGRRRTRRADHAQAGDADRRGGWRRFARRGILGRAPPLRSPGTGAAADARLRGPSTGRRHPPRSDRASGHARRRLADLHLGNCSSRVRPRAAGVDQSDAVGARSFPDTRPRGWSTTLPT